MNTDLPESYPNSEIAIPVVGVITDSDKVLVGHKTNKGELVLA